MRARNIKPGFFENDLLVELPFEFRLLFVGLWTMADKAGRLEDRPKKIKMCVFPADDVDVNRGLTDLTRLGFIQRYEVGELKYIQVVNWKKHQKPHHTEKDSVIPPCSNGDDTDNSRNNDGGNRSDSLISDSLIPDSLIPDSRADAHGTHDSGTPDPQQKPKLAPGQALPEYSMEFLQIVELYPRKEGIEDAWITFKGLKAAHAYPGNPIALPVLAQWTKSERWTEEGGKYVPSLKKWLQGKRWQDEPPKPKGQVSPAPGQNAEAMVKSAAAVISKLSDAKRTATPMPKGFREKFLGGAS